MISKGMKEQNLNLVYNLKCYARKIDCNFSNSLLITIHLKAKFRVYSIRFANPDCTMTNQLIITSCSSMSSYEIQLVFSVHIILIGREKSNKI